MTIGAREIKKAGGLEAWMRKQEGQRMMQKAKGKLPANKRLGYRADAMNKLEAEYAEHLEQERLKGNIVLWKYESVKFRLADRTWYTPDFWLVKADGSVELHETKGFMQEDANVKLKAVSEQFRECRFFLVRKVKGHWTWEEK